MAIENYEILDICKLMNVTELGWHVALHLTPMGDGFGRAKLLGSAAGLHKWTLSANAISDYDDRLIEDQPYFTFLLEFIKRHVRLNNKPFIIKDPRTGKYYMASFVEPRADFRWITQKLFAGGLQVEQRRVLDVDFNDDGSIQQPDINPPTVPTGLFATVVSATAITWEWEPSTDDIGVTGYEISLDGGAWTDVGNVLIYPGTGFDAESLHGLRVRAYDAAGNRSAASAEVSATTDALPFNVALATSGSTVTANRQDFPAANLINGFRTGSSNADTFQANGTGQWVEIDFGTTRTIFEINFISRNVSGLGIDPTLSTNGGYMSNNDLEMFYWNGASWTSLGNIGNQMAWKQWLFSPVSTTKVRMEALAVAGGALYAMEFEVIGS